LQHATNPVDWYPWGEEALAESKRRDVPILLSIGYSACHWCHVMERESFENEAVARLMNELFVCVKVDREERPDLDQIYQLTVQLMGRTGGWPLTVFLTPAQRPFFAGTYFPEADRHGMPGLPTILRAVSEAYRKLRDEVEQQAGELTQAIADIGRGETTAGAYTPAPDLLLRASRVLLRRFDDVHGGFGTRPKFPNTMPLEVMLRRGVLDDDGSARDAVRLALETMRRGGIWDQLGGGFHRYSTDERWLVPHFEKMLYDNALLLRAYVDGHRVFGGELFASTARDLAAYVTREMTDPSGGYHASQDADSEGEEGKFFVWSPAEVRAVLGADEPAIRVTLAYFGITEEGNFEEHGRATRMTVLHESRPLRAVAARLDMTEADAQAALARARSALFDAREGRPRPFRDEKILTSWSALMLGAMAEAGAALGEPALVASAARALAMIEERLVVRVGMKGGTGGKARALRLVKGEVVKGPGFLDDHAYLASAALDLYEVTGEPAHVGLARALVEGMLEAFTDEGKAEGGFFFAPRDGESLITRARDPYDNAVPSGASMACRALLRLGTLVDPRYAAIAERILVGLAPSMVENPFAYGQAICELDRVVRGSVDVVLVGPRDDARTRALAEVVFQRWIPNRTVAWLDPADPASREACAALGADKPAGEVPVAYVCRGRTCSLPVATPGELAALLVPRPSSQRPSQASQR